MMGFWSKKPDKIQSAIPYRSALARSGEDFTVFSSEHWVPIKIWLPGPLDEILQQLSDHFECSQSELIRQALFVYVYGRYRFEQMRAQRGGLFIEQQVQFSLETDPSAVSVKKNRAPKLGKNYINTKVHLPERLKLDLKALAAKSGITLSHFSREILISTFLGHQTLPERAFPPTSSEENQRTDPD